MNAEREIDRPDREIQALKAAAGPTRARKKIVYVASSADINGATISLLNLFLHLDRCVFEPVLILPGEGSILGYAQLPTSHVRFIKISQLRRDLLSVCRYLVRFIPEVFRLYQAFKREAADVVHINSIYNLQPGLAAMIARIPIAYHIHEVEESYPRFLFRIWALVVRALASGIIVVSQWAARPFGTKGGKTDVVDDILDEKRFYPQPKNASFIEQYSLDSLEDKFVILVPSHIMEGKGQLYALEAFADIIRFKQDVVMVFAGGANNVAINERYMAFLKERARDLGVDGSVVFVGPMTEMAQTFAVADIVVFPSLCESFGMPILEAMAMAKPLVTSRVGVAERIIAPEESGFVVSPGESGEIALAVKRLLADGHLREKVGSMAREQFEACYSVARCVGQFEQVYARLMGPER